VKTTEIKIIASINVGEIMWANIDLACVWRPTNLAEAVTNLGGFQKQSQDGTEFHPDSALKRPLKTCMKLMSAEFTMENSW